MVSVNGYTAEKMLEIENETIVDGNVVVNDLILIRRDGIEINAGNVRGPIGPAGPPGGLGEAPSDGTTYGRKDGKPFQLTEHMVFLVLLKQLFHKDRLLLLLI